MVAPQRLPVSATPLVGRARELVLLRQLLLDGDVRAVTITGPAGSARHHSRWRCCVASTQGRLKANP